jgi:hypothetical protein
VTPKTAKGPDGRPAPCLVSLFEAARTPTSSQTKYDTDYWSRTAGETATGMIMAKVFNPEELRAINRGIAERILSQYKRICPPVDLDRHAGECPHQCETKAGPAA